MGRKVRRLDFPLLGYTQEEIENDEGKTVFCLTILFIVFNIGFQALIYLLKILLRIFFNVSVISGKKKVPINDKRMKNNVIHY